RLSGREPPAFLPGDSLEGRASNGQDSWIDLDVISLVVVQEVVVRVDGRRVASNDHRVEMKGVRESSDDGQLIARGAGLCGARGRPWLCVGVGESAGNVFVG